MIAIFLMETLRLKRNIDIKIHQGIVINIFKFFAFNKNIFESIIKSGTYR